MKVVDEFPVLGQNLLQKKVVLGSIILETKKPADFGSGCKSIAHDPLLMRNIDKTFRSEGSEVTNIQFFRSIYIQVLMKCLKRNSFRSDVSKVV